MRDAKEAVASAVSRETLRRFEIMVDLLLRWQTMLNLVSASTLPDVWSRHIADSMQLIKNAPNAKVWADLGSGAGFPGLIIAILLADNVEAMVHLIESDRRKCAFLREVIWATGAKAEIHCARVETTLNNIRGIEAITARGFASLEKILALTERKLMESATGIFPRGLQVVDELTLRTKYVSFDFRFIRSEADPASQIVIVQRKFKDQSRIQE